MCECCKTIEIIKDGMRYNNNLTVETELKAKLISIATKEHKLYGEAEFATYKLNYCPMCGRKL